MIAAKAKNEKKVWINLSNRKAKGKEGNQKDGCPSSNKSQNDQFNGACREIEKKLGRKLDRDEKQRIHRRISKQDYNYHEVIEEGYWECYGE